MSRPAKVPPETVAAALVAQFRRSGFAGASLRDLGAASGLRTASLYHRFSEGKLGIAIAALDHVGTAFVEDVLGPLRDEGDAADRLERSADGVRLFYDDGRLVCLLAVFALSDAPPALLEQVGATFALWRRELGSVLAEAGAVDAEALAEDRVARIQGALVMARAGGSPATFQRAVTALAALP